MGGVGHVVAGVVDVGVLELGLDELVGEVVAAHRRVGVGHGRSNLGDIVAVA